MKAKRLYIMAVLLSGSLFFGPTYGQMKVGGGIFYGTYLGNLGLDIRASFRLIDQLYVSAKLDVSFPEITSYGATFMNELGLHAKYHVYEKGGIALYPLAGLTLQNMIWVNTNPVNLNAGFHVGVTAGGGAILKITDNLEAFGEATFTLAGHSQFKATVGGLFNLWSIEKRDEKKPVSNTDRQIIR